MHANSRGANDRSGRRRRGAPMNGGRGLRRRLRTGLKIAAVSAFMVGGLAFTSSPAMAAGVGLNGTGSSFAGPEISQWTIDTAKPPYNLNMNFTSSSSGDGRFQFANKTVNFGVTDIAYQPYPFDVTAPTFPFIYVPVTAGGLSFMYHLSGVSGTLQLSSYSACAIFSGDVTNWNDPIIAADNPGLSLPNLEIHPVIRSDLAGTNFVFQEWCIDDQPALWAAFTGSPAIKSLPGQVGDLSTTSPRSDWPVFPNAISENGSAAAADAVADPNDDGYITAVETSYALQRNFPVASVKNASGDYTQPSRGRRGVCPGIRNPAPGRHPPVELWRYRAARLQPVYIQLPPVPDDRVERGGRGRPQSVRELRG